MWRGASHRTRHTIGCTTSLTNCLASHWTIFLKIKNYKLCSFWTSPISLKPTRSVIFFLDDYCMSFFWTILWITFYCNRQLVILCKRFARLVLLQKFPFDRSLIWPADHCCYPKDTIPKKDYPNSSECWDFRLETLYLMIFTSFGLQTLTDLTANDGRRPLGQWCVRATSVECQLTDRSSTTWLKWLCATIINYNQTLTATLKPQKSLQNALVMPSDVLPANKVWRISLI